MKNLEFNYQYQKSSDQMWQDEKGIEIPYNRTTKSERLQERQANKVASHAIKLNTQLTAFKKDLKAICKDVYDTYMKEHGTIGKGKGNFTWKNFDGSIKIECSISNRIVFDDLAVEASKAKLNEFLDNNVKSEDGVIKQLVLDAFETSRGRLDAKKVMSLFGYRSKIKNPLFHEALNILEDGITRPESKEYYRVFVKDENGSYQNIDLNLSSI